MNVMNVMIGSTFALLVAGLFISYSSMKSTPTETPAALEIARLEKREAQLETALAKGKAEQQNYTSQFESAPSQFSPMSGSNELEKVRAELLNLKKERDSIEEKAGAVIEDALAHSSPDPKEKKRSSLIDTALVMARITEYDNVNKVAGIHIERVGNVNTGDVLGIRRNSGIIGRLTIGMIDRNQGVADPLPGSFLGGSIDIQEGDELILPPD
ncbi:hypothetical protein ACFPK9_12620 [Rubritalea spongiae]|uniref:Uncharacterized protein n=1 Tax=Rubritalea spongiae TaxID=430797 RepID=A0ABW5E8X9_9BACT